MVQLLFYHHPKASIDIWLVLDYWKREDVARLLEKLWLWGTGSLLAFTGHLKMLCCAIFGPASFCHPQAWIDIWLVLLVLLIGKVRMWHGSWKSCEWGTGSLRSSAAGKTWHLALVAVANQISKRPTLCFLPMGCHPRIENYSQKLSQLKWN